MDNRAIGVFDSGVGGLTVVKEIISQLPNEDIVYFGDTARVPYGTKSPDIVTKYSVQNIRFLLTKNVKAIVVACNTASALALNTVKNQFDIPIIGVVEPGAETAVANTKSKRIGVIGTPATISSKAYGNVIRSLDKEAITFEVACPLFVPLVEEGWLDNEITYKIIEEYLKTFKDKSIDALILGCTHYPLLIKTIGEVIGKDIKLINPAFETAMKLKGILKQYDILKEKPTEAEYKYFLSDIGAKFENIASYCLKKKIDYIEKVDIEQF